MANVELIKELRLLTDLSIGEITKALNEAGGDKDRALELLKEIGAKVSSKKAERTATEGIIESYIHGNRKVGVLLELNCETDFVAKNPAFSELAHEISMHIAAMNPEAIDSLLAQEFIKEPNINV